MSDTTATSPPQNVPQSDARLAAHERVAQLLDHLGLPRAHLAGRHPAVLGELLGARPDLVASATLVCPPPFDPAPFRPIADRVLAVLSDRGPAADAGRRALAQLPGAAAAVLPGYEALPWSDLVADRPEVIGDALLAFLDGVVPEGLGPAGLPEGAGAVAAVSYRIRGSGPPLVLFPLGLAPSQWDALLPRLAARYCTIALGGAHLGVVATLEERGHTRGYLDVVAAVADALDLRPGRRVLEVGCGSGVLCRWLARRIGGDTPVVGVDVNRYFLREAAALAAQEGLAGRIDFREGDATALPFADASFDAVLSATVLEEVDADRALAELVRVTRPGGRVGAVVRATDVPFWYHLALPPDLKAKAERVSGPGAGPGGCADGSLLRRCRAAGLADARAWLQMATLYPGRDTWELWAYYQNWALGALRDDEAAAWRVAVSQAEAAGTLFWAFPHHCAVGTKR
jgi:SAM-dependent methyltransferase